MLRGKARFTVREAIASHLGEDVEEVSARRYQPTRTPCPVYTVGNDYLTATRKRSPRESDDMHYGRWEWEEIETHGYAKAQGWRIWRAKV